VALAARFPASGVAVTASAGGLSACFGLGEDNEENRRPDVIATSATTVPLAAPEPQTELKHKKKPRRSLARLVGQKFVVSYRQTTAPPPQLLQRIECGEVGGVILFTGNVPPAGAAGIRCTVARLQRAANAGGNPLLLIATDQEGGNVRRMLGVPRRSPRELEPARRRRRARPVSRPVAPCARWGIAVNLAPVADIPTDAWSFLGTRAFGPSTQPNIRSAVAFTNRLQRAGVAATAKHYPGLGSSGRCSTGLAAVTIDTPRAAMERERAAFLHAVSGGTRLVMVSNATYLAYDGSRPAVVSPKIVGRLRRRGFYGVVISDELRVPRLQRFGTHTAGTATRAGIDVLLFAGASGEVEYHSLLAGVKAGRVRRSLVERQVRRIASLKRWIASEARDERIRPFQLSTGGTA
jgi:beta-N-acetylhexosaminidase